MDIFCLHLVKVEFNPLLVVAEVTTDHYKLSAHREPKVWEEKGGSRCPLVRNVFSLVTDRQ